MGSRIRPEGKKKEYEKDGAKLWTAQEGKIVRGGGWGMGGPIHRLGSTRELEELRQKDCKRGGQGSLQAGRKERRGENY